MKNRALGASCILATLSAVIAVGCGQTNDSASSPPLGEAPASLLSRHAMLGAIPGSHARARGVATDAARPRAERVADAGSPIPSKYQAFAAAFDAERESLGASGATVAILEHGELSFVHASGTKGPNSTAPVDARTLFRIGSMTKSLTAARFLQATEAGQATTTERLTALEPNVALSGPDAPYVRMNQLLSQTSGLFDFTNYGSNPAPSFACSTGPDVLQSFVTGTVFGADESFQSPPGAAWAYSNPNFVLAGAAIERATGLAYVDTMEQKLLRPLRMSRTFFLPSEVLADGDYSDGLSTNADGSPWDVTPASYDCAWFRPAGYAFSNVLDFAKYMQFLLAGDPKVLSDANRLAMQAAQADTFLYGSTYSYGYGLYVQSGIGQPSGYYPTKVVSHDGAIPGYSAQFYLLPETGFGIVMLANADDVYFSTSFEQALRSFGSLPAPTAIPPSAKIDPSLFPVFAGDYLDPSGNFGTLVVTAQNGTLTIDMPLLDSAGITYEPTLQALSSHEFVLTLTGEYAQTFGLTFIRGGSFAHAGWILIDQGLLAARVKGDAAAGE